MAKIKIDFLGVQAANLNICNVYKTLDRVDTALYAIQRGLDPQVQMRHDIRNRMVLCREIAKETFKKSKKLSNVLDNGVNAYRATETRLCRNAPNDDI